MPPDDPVVLPPRPAPPRGGVLADRIEALRHDPRTAVVALLICALAAGGFWFRSSLHAGALPTTTTETAQSGAGGGSKNGGASDASPRATTTTVAAATVVVHVAGAVLRPGVVTLPAGSRVVDAVRAAGGARAGADLDRLDLAAKLADGIRIAVPMRGEPAPPLDAGASTNGGTASGNGATSGPINLNTASQEELETLPGIGPTLAAAIIAERDRTGGFTSVDDLRRVHGIGDARFAQLQPLVTV